MIENKLRQRLDEIRKQPKSWTEGVRLFPRNDDVLLASEICDQISDKASPGVFADGDFWVYDDKTGAWGLLDRVEIRRAVMGLSGARVFVKTVKEKDEDGKEIERTVSEALNLSSQRIRGLSSLVEDILQEEAHFMNATQGLAFTNGLAIATAKGVVLGAKSPHHRARNPVDAAWRNTPAPKWDAFLDGCFRDDKDRQQKKMFLQEFIGVCLTGDVTYHEKYAILYGGGSNGKGVFLDVVESIFPEDGVAAIPFQMWGNEYYRARLKGIQMNIVSELPKRDIVDSPAVNAVISGDPIEARSPTEKPFKFRPRAGHMVAANPPLPVAGDLSHGFWRRPVMVSFERRFTDDPERREKKEFERELKAERLGIISWALEGACRVKRQAGFTDVPSSSHYLDEWRTGSDQVAMFVREACMVTDKQDHMWNEYDLFQYYRKWAERTGHRMPVSLSRFCERLTLLGHTELTLGAKRARPLMVLMESDPSRPAFDEPPESSPLRPSSQPGLFGRGAPGFRR